MTFDEWQAKHGQNGGAYDIEMQKAGWNGATAESASEIEKLRNDKAELITALDLAFGHIDQNAYCNSWAIVRAVLDKHLSNGA